MRSGAVTASPRTVPACTNGNAVEVPTMNIATSPEIRAEMHCCDEPRCIESFPTNPYGMYFLSW